MFEKVGAMKKSPRYRLRNPVAGTASLFAFLLFVCSSPFAFAQSEWPTWPLKEKTPAPAESPKGKITEEPLEEGAPAEPPSATPETEAAAKAGEVSGKRAKAGISSGTLGWAAAIIGAGVVIGVAAGGGGGGSTSNH